MLKDNSIQTLGLAMKAGALVSGETAVENAIRDGSALRVIITEDASANTKKKFTDKCKFYEVQYTYRYYKEDLGRIIGKNVRSVAAITDEGFAKLFDKKTTINNDDNSMRK